MLVVQENKAKNTVSFFQQQPGLLVTQELAKALDECKARVEELADECRRKNRKFRDLEFDLEHDKKSCLYGLFEEGKERYDPADVDRVTQIFDNPRFFVDGAVDSDDIKQGGLGDCWFLSALATVSTLPGLLESLCVARDERVGIYGFIFFRDYRWVTVVIDDLLYTRVPKYEELSSSEQVLYHFDKDNFNSSARKGGKTLYFAQSGKHGETWVALIEKAYAKVHGSYAALNGGEDCEAVEDLTGGVSTIMMTKDILDVDRFWKEELLLANKDRLFGCAFNDINAVRNGRYVSNIRAQGLIGGHAYSVLKAVECRGKKFLVVRNPWGNTEWTGRWSDGSKEWTGEWLEILPQLGHRFGDDGQFVMEYSDWLSCFTQINRTRLFDSDWIMSSQWLQAKTRPLPSAWTYGDVSFNFVLPAASSTVIVISKLDKRYYLDIAGRVSWSIDFVLVKEGIPKPIAWSTSPLFWSRSTSLEIDLEPGKYHVYVRLDRSLEDVENPRVDDRKLRKLSKTLAQRAKSQSIASNYDSKNDAQYIPVDLHALIVQDWEVIQRRNTLESLAAARTEEGTAVGTTSEEDGDSEYESPVSMTAPDIPAPVFIRIPAQKNTNPKKHKRNKKKTKQARFSEEPDTYGSDGGSVSDTAFAEYMYAEADVDGSKPTSILSAEFGSIPTPHDDDNTLFVGLRVYTNRNVPVVVVGRLKSDPEEDIPLGVKPDGTKAEPKHTQHEQQLHRYLTA